MKALGKGSPATSSPSTTTSSPGQGGAGKDGSGNGSTLACKFFLDGQAIRHPRDRRDPKAVANLPTRGTAEPTKLQLLHYSPRLDIGGADKRSGWWRWC